MLDPFTAIGLASAVIQFTDFGIKVVSESLKLCTSSESDLEPKIERISLLADRFESSFGNDTDGSQKKRDTQEPEKLVKICKSIASELLSVLGSLKANKPAGPGRLYESFQEAVVAQMPWNKKKVASLERELGSVQNEILIWIQVSMR